MIAYPVHAGGLERIGDRINVMLGDPETFIAGEPFHIVHGFRTTPSESPIGAHLFELEVDSVFVDPDFVLHDVIGHDPTEIRYGWVFNFPEGMDSGPHTFTGHWYWPCRWLVENGHIPGPCPTPNAKTEFLTIEHTVIFTSD